MTASIHGHVDIVRMLIEAKAQINTQEEVCCSYHQKTYCTIITPSVIVPAHELCFCPQVGWTALHLAAQEGNVDVVTLLTEARAHVNIQTKVHVHTHACIRTRNVVTTSITACIIMADSTLLTLDECHVVSWSDECTCTYDYILYRMVRLLFTLPAGKDMDQLLNYYFKQNTQMSTSVGRYTCMTPIQLPTLLLALYMYM